MRWLIGLIVFMFQKLFLLLFPYLYHHALTIESGPFSFSLSTTSPLVLCRAHLRARQPNLFAPGVFLHSRPFFPPSARSRCLATLSFSISYVHVHVHVFSFLFGTFPSQADCDKKKRMAGQIWRDAPSFFSLLSLTLGGFADYGCLPRSR